jgi:ribosomal protein S12
MPIIESYPSAAQSRHSFKYKTADSSHVRAGMRLRVIDLPGVKWRIMRYSVSLHQLPIIYRPFSER